MAGNRTDPTRFGYTNEEWDRAVDAGVRILKEVAGSPEGVINYTDLCERIFAVSDVRIVPGEYALPYVLGDISKVTLASDGCAVTALVTYKDSPEPGGGLYTLAVEEGLLPKHPTERQKDEFRIEHMNKALRLWPRERHRPGERYSNPRGGDT